MVKYFIKASIDKKTHKILNHINVGKVFLVDDQIKDKLENKDKTYRNQICKLNKSPGTIIIAFIKKEKNSIVLGLFQYSLFFINFSESNHSALFEKQLSIMIRHI